MGKTNNSPATGRFVSRIGQTSKLDGIIAQHTSCIRNLCTRGPPHGTFFSLITMFLRASDPRLEVPYLNESCCTSMIMSPFVLDRNVPLIEPPEGGQIGADRHEQAG